VKAVRYMEDGKRHIDGREFVSLITANQRRIYAYILTLVPNRSDADDIMQDTTALMWERKDDFSSGTDFAAWGARIAYFKVLDYRKRINKNRRIIASEQQLCQIEKQAFQQGKHRYSMVDKLERCVGRLTDQDRQVLRMRYSLELSVKEMSRRFNKSIRSIYLRLSSIQSLLLSCLERENV